MDFQHLQGFTGKAMEKKEHNIDLPGKCDDRKVFVGGLPQETKNEDLFQYFSQFGQIEAVTVKKDLETGHSRGFGFVVFTNSKSVYKVLELGNHYINRKKVEAKKVYSKSQEGKIFVGGLTPTITYHDIRDYFSQYGKIVNIETPLDKISRENKGYCFVTFQSKEAVNDLLKGVFSKYVHYIAGKQVEVNKALAKPETQVSGDRGGVSGYRGWLGIGGGLRNSRGGFGSLGGALSSTVGNCLPPWGSFGSPWGDLGSPQSGYGPFGGPYVPLGMGFGFPGPGAMQDFGTGIISGTALENYMKLNYKAHSGFGIDDAQVYDAVTKQRVLARSLQRHQPY